MTVRDDVPDEPEWVVWATTGGILALDNGRSVQVAYGDVVLMEEREGGVAFLAHRPRTLH